MTYVSSLPIAKASSEHRTLAGAAAMVRAGMPAELAIASAGFDNLNLVLEPADGILWARQAQAGRPMCSPEILADVAVMQDTLRDVYSAAAEAGKPKPFKYLVFGSATPGVFNLGGDLGLFVDRARAGDHDTIRRYARTCVELGYENSRALGLPIVTIALVQGDALGGGFEIALQWDMIVAERSAKFCLPEILFGMFPGMGAYSFLSRRIAPAKAKEMILSGRMYTAEELHETGIIDVLAEDGQGEAAVYEHVRRMAGKHNAERAFYNTRRRVNPITLEELYDVVDTWADAVFELSAADLRKMEFLIARQDRRMSKLATSNPAK